MAEPADVTGSAGQRAPITCAQANRSAARRRAVPLLGILIGAGLTATAAAPTWYSQGYQSGPVAALRRSGSQAAPGLLPLALVAVAGIAAALAVRGTLRRVVGLLVAVVGVITAVIAAAGLIDPPVTAAGDDGPPLTSGRLVIVMGATGDRDPGKRRPLGRR